MADVALTVQQIDVDGHAATYTTPNTTDTYKVNNDARMALHCKKTGAGACTVTVATPLTVGGLAVAERTVVVPATTGDVFIGPFPPNEYNDTAGQIAVTFSDVAGLSVAALRI